MTTVVGSNGTATQPIQNVSEKQNNDEETMEISDTDEKPTANQKQQEEQKEDDDDDDVEIIKEEPAKPVRPVKRKAAEVSKEDEEDDNDVFIVKEEDVVSEEKQKAAEAFHEEEEQSEAEENESTLDEVIHIIEDAKNIIKLHDHEMKSINEQLQKMKGSIDASVLEAVNYVLDNPKGTLSTSMDKPDLEKMIDSILAGFPMEDIFDLTKEEFELFDDKLHFIERTNQNVSKLFLDCHSRLKEFKTAISSETTDIDKEIAEYEKKMSQNCVLIDSDDDDVTCLTQGDSSKSNNASPDKGQLSRGNSQSMPSMDQLRTQFANAVNKSIPNSSNLLNHQQPSDLTAPQRTGPVAPQPVRWPELKVQDKVLGKKFNDVWYGGTILDIYPAVPEEKNEWRCKVKFDGKGMKTLPGRHVAYKDPINCFLRVGTRVVAVYREDDAPSSFYAGVIAEAPSIKNNRRFLVFFDDGYAQYCDAKELHKVYMQSENVWEDINIETSAFIKEYLRIYPERPMVRLSKGQVVRTEWNGKWWTAKVQETDASLVKMYFQADKRTEWIYRGSTRLEPLFKALANADAIKAAGSARGRRHNLNMKPSDSLTKPSVEYTRGVSEEDSNSSNSSMAMSGSKSKPSGGNKRKSNVAKKSTGGLTPTATSNDPSKPGQWEAPWIRYQRKAQPGSQKSQSSDSSKQETEKASNKNQGESKSSKDIASILQERLATTSTEVEYDEENATGERKEIKLDLRDIVWRPFRLHNCSPLCINDPVEDNRLKGYNSLTIPLLCGWERQVCKARPTAKRHVIYRAPCGRRLRTIEEVDQFLLLTDCSLTIDLFCFDHQLHVNTEFVPVKTFCDIKDLSYGKENYPISCVNGIDRHYPDYVEYSDHRIPSKGVKLNLDPNFLSCCDCTDNCRDRSKCACQQMTIQNTSWIGEVDPEAGYHYRRLPEPLFTGIVECNVRCKCDKRCLNKVAQLGLQMRLQVFKTEKKGWGLRCLDDIPKGSFLCIYAGQLLTDRGANEDGKQYGDEYLAELDFIEVVERQKEGYESDVEAEGMDFSDGSDSNYKASKDSDDDSDFDYKQKCPLEASKRKLRKRIQQNNAQNSIKEKEKETKPDSPIPEATVSAISDPISISDEDDDEDEENVEPQVASDKTVSDATSNHKLKARAKKSTGGSRFNLSTSIKQSHEANADKADKEDKKERLPTRTFFHDDTECYIMDAKSMGNLGRYLNHSCSPNVFVQNIFVDTHDLRFPWVAFFAGQYIRAGTELTWDYNYEVGSVPDKILYCYCGSSVCRGRLL